MKISRQQAPIFPRTRRNNFSITDNMNHLIIRAKLRDFVEMIYSLSKYKEEQKSTFLSLSAFTKTLDGICLFV